MWSSVVYTRKVRPKHLLSGGPGVRPFDPTQHGQEAEARTELNDSWGDRLETQQTLLFKTLGSVIFFSFFYLLKTKTQKNGRLGKWLLTFLFCHHRNKWKHLKTYSNRKHVKLNGKNISQYYCFYCIFDQLNATLVMVSIRDCSTFEWYVSETKSG